MPRASSARPWIVRYARKYGVDPRAALSVALGEGGLSWGSVGDQGTSFGPFQLHVGGALPAGRGSAWANSPAGIEYAIRSMAQSGARGLTGSAAINSIVRRFERPADPDASVHNALGRYGSSQADFISSQPNQRFGSQPSGAQSVFDRHAYGLALLQQLGSGGYHPQEMLSRMGDFRTRTPTVMRSPTNAPVQGQGWAGTPTSGAGILGGKWTMGGGISEHMSRPLGNWQSDHAWDMMAPAGTPVYAPANTIVTKARFSDNGKTVWGYQVTLSGSGNSFFLTHLGSLAKNLRVGRRLRRGQLIGWLGNPPYFAPHLHIGIKRGDIRNYL